MAIRTISELPEKLNLSNSDLFVVDDGDNNYRITFQQLIALLPCVKEFSTNNNTGTISIKLTNNQTLSIVPHDPDKLNASAYVVFTGATAQGEGAAGIVPKPTALNKYLGSGGAWETPDTTPTENSNKLLTSGGMYNVLKGYVDIQNNAGFHNSIFRGKNLGSSLTTEQKNAIAAGTFDDMFIGDYWEINSIKWRIAHFDYWYRSGDTQCTTHHVVVVPDNVLNYKNMNDKVNNADVTTGAYINSKMYTTNIADARTIVKNAFGESNILTHREYFANATNANGFESGGSWYDSQIDLMNEIMVYGSNIFHNCINGTSWPTNYTIDKVQLALFRLDQSYTIALNPQGTDRSHWWLRDVCFTTYFASVNGNGFASFNGASSGLGVRPAFAIK